MFDETFESKIYSTELPAWKFLNLLVRGFLSNKGEKLFRNHKRSAAEIQQSRCWLSLKIHCLHSYIDFFLRNLRAVGEEKGDGLLLVYGKNGARVSRKVESDWDT